MENQIFSHRETLVIVSVVQMIVKKKNAKSVKRFSMVIARFAQKMKHMKC